MLRSTEGVIKEQAWVMAREGESDQTSIEVNNFQTSQTASKTVRESHEEVCTFCRFVPSFLFFWRQIISIAGLQILKAKCVLVQQSNISAWRDVFLSTKFYAFSAPFVSCLCCPAVVSSEVGTQTHSECKCTSKREQYYDSRPILSLQWSRLITT